MATKTGTMGGKPMTKYEKNKAQRAKRLAEYHELVEKQLEWTPEMEAKFALDVRDLENEFRAGVAGSGKVSWDELQALLQNATALNPKQEQFVSGFLRYRNGVRAATFAGYKNPEKSAKYMLLMHPTIRHEIQRRVQLAQIKHDIEADEVLKELAAIAFVNLDDFVETHNDGAEATLTLKWATRSQMSAMKELSQETYLVPDGSGEPDAPKQVVKKMQIKMHDKLRALEHLSKLLHLYPEDKPEGEGTRLAQAIMESVREMKRREGTL